MNVDCPYCFSPKLPSGLQPQVVRYGSFFRKSDRALLPRFLCKACCKTFSPATRSPCRNQKKRYLNTQIFHQLVSGVSQRRLARLLLINRKTVVRKFIFLGLFSDACLTQLRAMSAPASVIEFDDLETFEHSKLKPLSVTMAVEFKSRRILGFKVARMPAKGLLVQKSLKKYGKRKDERKTKRRELFKEIKPHVNPRAIVKSDENPHYSNCVKTYFPQCDYKTYKGRRGCVVGQGELKSGGYDPLYTLNHTFAMFRANINRLFRRTWNTTKKPERLHLHIALYVLYHNLVIINSENL